jgi:endothelin-converting enzyme/putative endopeptidase
MRSRPPTAALAVLLALGFAARVPTQSAPAAAAKPTFGTFGIDTAQMDASVKPGDDFYRYVNGRWLSTFAIPPDKAAYGAFDLLADKAEADVRALITELGKTPPAAGTVAQKVVDLYGGWMDEAAIEARGLAPIKADLEAIAAASAKPDIVALMGRLDYSAPFGTYIIPDPADPTRYVVGITQSGLGMPVRDYYLNPGEKFDGYRAAYTVYLTKIFELIGDTAPAESAKTVLALETKLAQVHWAPEKQRDIQAINNPMDRAALQKTVPAIDWNVALESSGLGKVQHFLVNEISALVDGTALLDREPVAAWRKYLAFHLTSQYASHLPKAFDDASFAFYRKALNGVETKRDRWKRGMQLLDQLIGEGVGELYVARHFPPGHKAKMDELVANLRVAMEARLKALPWMDDATRTAALKKLATFEPRIGYPSAWRDYAGYTVVKGRHLENVRNGRAFEWKRQVARLGTKVDRSEWDMNPQTVNASYNPLMNQITFPAAILQAPFFDPQADPAVNYGAIGAVIGHEIGHGFDDQGREFDDTGRIRNWWSESTNTQFLARTGKLAAQAAAHCPLPNTCVNGKLTMGENIGDLGGLEMAYHAYTLSLKGGKAPVIGGFTGDQRFFMSHAQIWRAKMRDDALRNLILSNPHAPPALRGSLAERNMDAWYAAFAVKPGDKAYIAPDQRVRIW